eukprot:gnl/MRDRNA2_/MRDRNA2_105439_c0_seq1.p1 gnl/MRDRNA2_/MRDRNA2_105439_c0~~gnl/MRDRNA2_/MRDRNA2_105439_c0_seq1.p1  ORF type:complete len:284 (+),score=84.47 gnl/MRDRNA2_/MRDRNA2_105439_c0_seq1:125-976(+)
MVKGPGTFEKIKGTGIVKKKGGVAVRVVTADGKEFPLEAKDAVIKYLNSIGQKPPEAQTVQVQQGKNKLEKIKGTKIKMVKGGSHVRVIEKDGKEFPIEATEQVMKHLKSIGQEPILTQNGKTGSTLPVKKKEKMSKKEEQLSKKEEIALHRESCANNQKVQLNGLVAKIKKSSLVKGDIVYEKITEATDAEQKCTVTIACLPGYEGSQFMGEAATYKEAEQMAAREAIATINADQDLQVQKIMADEERAAKKHQSFKKFLTKKGEKDEHQEWVNKLKLKHGL